MVKKNKTGQIILNIILIFFAACCVLPFLLLVISSLTDETTLVRNGYSFFPAKFSLESYLYLWRSQATIVKAYSITVTVAAIGTIASILITIHLSYPLSRKNLPGRNIFAFIIFFTMLFNGGLVPSYMMWTQVFKIKNTLWALLIPSLLMNAFYVMIMRSYFSSNIQDALIEAAKIDGAGEYTILYRIVLPLSKPMVATLALMIGIGYWNDWMNGLYYLTDSKLFSIQNVLNRMISNIQFISSGVSDIDTGTMAANLPSVGIRMAIAVIGILPIMIIYPFFQKYFVKGIAIGGVKG